jgi:hypothetical protein
LEVVVRSLLSLVVLLALAVPSFAEELPGNLTTTQTKLALRRYLAKNPDAQKRYSETVRIAEKNGKLKALSEAMNAWSQTGKLDAEGFDRVLAEFGGLAPNVDAPAKQPVKDKRPTQADFIKFTGAHKFHTEEAKAHFEKIMASEMLEDRIAKTVMGRLLYFARQIPKSKMEKDQPKLVKRAEAVVEKWYMHYGRHLSMDHLEDGILNMEDLLLKSETEKVDVEVSIKGLEEILNEDPKNLTNQAEAFMRGELRNKKN